MFSRALAHHRLGQGRDAERCYRDALAIDPGHAGSLHHLGLLALQEGRHQDAANLIGRAIALNGNVPECHYQIGIALGSLGCFEAAAAHNRRAIELRPGYAEAHINLGNALKAQVRHAEALESYRRALALQPRSHDAHYNIGNLLADLGTFAEAVDHYKAALAISPDHAPTHNNLATALAALGALEDAIGHYQRAATLDPGMVQVAINLANALREAGNGADAAHWYRRAIEHEPNAISAHQGLGAVLAASGDAEGAQRCFEQARRLTADVHNACMQQGLARMEVGDIGGALTLFKRANDADETAQGKALLFKCLSDPRSGPHAHLYQREIVRSLLEPWGDPRDIVNVGVAVLLQDSQLNKCLQRVAKAESDTADLAAIAENQIFHALLIAGPFSWIGGDRHLRALRSALLDLVAKANGNAADDDLLALHCALARQCFLNEYVLGCSAAERQKAFDLRDALVAALETDGAVAASWIAAVGSYLPLGSLPAAAAEALVRRPSPAPIAPLLAQQIAEPQSEAQSAASILALTSIEDRVSVQVRQQYEKNPYPRWQAIKVLFPPVAFADYLRGQFPLASIRIDGAGQPLDYLVAGCGTGRQVAVIAQAFSDLRVTAIDLSRSSLGYARRKTEEMGLAGVVYNQADILKISSIGKTFDAIDACGVLHHMADPWAGWRALLEVLRSHGCMRVALYSERGRGPVRAAQRLIADRAYGNTDDDIRGARQDILALPDGAPAKGVTRLLDFYSLSECRDMLFHVHEHDFDLLQIGEFLADNELELIGFETDPAVLQRYSQNFPKDAARTDLANWRALEQQDAGTFGSMYQFWVQRLTG
jgi:tetratricopeptide (TPR) repeat protein/SAM-dependent methyltransferase